MIEEAYVSFEVAKLLKEKGFNEECHKTYDIVTHDMCNFIHCGNYGLISNLISAPTQQMAMRYLREEKGICIEPYCLDQKYMCGFAKFPECTDIDCHQSYGEYDSYEEAVEAALKYVLENLI